MFYIFSDNEQFDNDTSLYSIQYPASRFAKQKEKLNVE